MTEVSCDFSLIIVNNSDGGDVVTDGGKYHALIMMIKLRKNRGADEDADSDGDSNNDDDEEETPSIMMETLVMAMTRQHIRITAGSEEEEVALKNGGVHLSPRSPSVLII